MRILSSIVIAVIFLLANNSAFAATTVKKEEGELKYVRYMLQQIINNNLRYERNFHDFVPESSLVKQEPDATVLLCSDSRVDTDAISDRPAGELFVVRNIGNQIKTAYGSVEYGVDHLHTRILLIVGHSQCGAVKAAMGDYSKESANLKNELVTLHTDPKQSLNQNIINNINYQVELAMDDFSKKIKDGNLVIIGMLYDIHNDFKFGNGKLIVVNINNQTDPKILAKNEYIQGLKHLQVLKED
jgi:carbonic anhydrase